MLEEGEKNSAYFFRLEKHRSTTNFINCLNTILKNPRHLPVFCANFYSSLYSSRYNEGSASLFLNNFQNLKIIDAEERSHLMLLKHFTQIVIALLK